MLPLRSGSALAQLYGTSATLEHHHFNHAVMILQSEVKSSCFIVICLVGCFTSQGMEINTTHKPSWVAHRAYMATGAWGAQHQAAAAQYQAPHTPRPVKTPCAVQLGLDVMCISIGWAAHGV